MMSTKLNDMINELVNIGRSTTSRPTSSAEILFRDDVNQCFDRCRRQMDPGLAVENSKQDILGLMANITANLIEQVHAAAFAPDGKFRRFVTMGEHMIKVLVFLTQQFLDQAEQSFDAVVAEENERHHQTGRNVNVGRMLKDLIACAKSELLELAIMIEELPLLPPRYLAMDPPDYLEHTRPLTATVVHPFGFVCNADGLVTKVADAERCEIPAGSTIIQIDDREFSLQSMLELSQGGQPVRFAYSQPGCSVVPSDRDVTTWLYHHQDVSREYLEERERFLSHRRAAENLVLVFGVETVEFAERVEFERMQGDRQLIRLDPDDDCDWYQPPRYHGVRVTLTETRDDLQLSLPGWCCTEGCSQAHDTAFNPCGHTVCCWECAHKLDKCPVCCIDLTVDMEQVRRSQALCYDDPSMEAAHEERVHAAKLRDAQAYLEAKAGYQELLLLFRAPAELDEESWDTLLHERGRQLQARPDVIPGQCELWPYHKHMVEFMAKERLRAADEVANAQQRAADDIARQQQECADNVWQQQQTCADAVATQRQECADTLATERQEHADELQQSADKLTLQQAASDVAMAAQKAQAAQILQQDTADIKAELYDYASKLEDALRQRDARVKKEFHTPDDGIDACQAPTCSNDFGLRTRRHHCRACGGIFCDDCAGKKGFVFETAGMKGAERKARRVCGECKAALEDSGGVRNRNVPANRPDGTPFGSGPPGFLGPPPGMGGPPGMGAPPGMGGPPLGMGRGGPPPGFSLPPGM
jgi:hypothetical protein